MKCRVRRNSGFRPVNVRLRFDSAVEYECFRALMSDSEETAIRISNRYTGFIFTKTGVNLAANEAKECLKGIMRRIWNRLPEGD